MEIVFWRTYTCFCALIGRWITNWGRWMVGFLMSQQYVRQTCDLVTCVLSWCKKDFGHMIHPEVILCGWQESKIQKLTNLVSHPIFSSKDEILSVEGWQSCSWEEINMPGYIMSPFYQSFTIIVLSHVIVLPRSCFLCMYFLKIHILWGCTSGAVYVPCIYKHARWELLQATLVFVVVLVLRIWSTN